jgi:replication-associated recombination protein RarA
LEYDATFWSYVLHQSGYGSYLWRRLIIILSEDIGNGDAQASSVVHALHQNWECLHKHNKQPELYKFFPVVHAVLYMCRCPKVRENDSLLNLVHEHFSDGKFLPIPEIALDSHTAKGRQLNGRLGNMKDGKELGRWERWFNESTVINKQAYPDQWEQSFKDLMFEKAKVSEA